MGPMCDMVWNAEPLLKLGIQFRVRNGFAILPSTPEEILWDRG